VEAARIYGHEPGTKPFRDVLLPRVHPDDVALVQREIDRASCEKAFDLEHRLLMPDGTIEHVQFFASGETGDDVRIGALMDVSAAKQAQDALSNAQAELAHVARVTALGQFAASIAYEVNQPLTAIATFGAAGLRWLGRQPPVLEEVRSSMESMIRDANRAIEIVQRIRGLSRKTSPQMTRLDVNGVIKEAAALAHHEAFRRRVPMRLQLAEGLPPVRGDRIQLQQVVINLVMNGIQAMAMVGDRARDVFIRTQQSDPSHIVVAVQDVDVGTEPENLDRLFVAFYTTKPDGLGMGLSICRSKGDHPTIGPIPFVIASFEATIRVGTPA